MSKPKYRGATLAHFRQLTSTQLIDLATDLDDRTGDLLIDEGQINEEAGYDKIAAWRSVAAMLRDEATRRN